MNSSIHIRKYKNDTLLIRVNSRVLSYKTLNTHGNKHAILRELKIELILKYEVASVLIAPTLVTQHYRVTS